MPSFTYMGTKKKLAEKIGTVCARLPDGPFLDLFSGISAAGAAVAKSRQVWCNDAQLFSKTLTQALYTSSDCGPRCSEVVSAVVGAGNRNLNTLLSRTHSLAEAEQRAIWDQEIDTFLALEEELRFAAAEAIGPERITDWQLFTTTYAGTYFGLTQSLQIDSIRCGIDKAFTSGAISSEDKRWAILALCKAMMATSNSTGHFAQFLTPNRSNAKRVISKRRRCVWSWWYSSLHEFKAIGTATWRSHNRVFGGDANVLLSELSQCADRPSVVYADPPYTNDQYSRFYHLLETAIHYDYPKVTGKGLYRPDRFRSTFSLATEIESSLRLMIQRSASVASSLVLSYPSNGLLADSLHGIPVMLQNHFSRVDDPIIIAHQHSTMGGSKGPNAEEVEEVIYVATSPR